MEDKKKKVSKYYNPYPFLVRVLNDLKKPQLLAPQAHCKVLGGVYDQSPLELIPVDKRGERVFKKSMRIELRRLSQEDLVNLAWTVLAADDRDVLGSLTKKDIIKIIEEKTGEKPKEDGNIEETSQDKVQVKEKSREEKNIEEIDHSEESPDDKPEESDSEGIVEIFADKEQEEPGDSVDHTQIDNKKVSKEKPSRSKSVRKGRDIQEG